MCRQRYYARVDRLAALEKAIVMRPKPLPKPKTKFFAVVVYNNETTYLIEGEFESPRHMWIKRLSRH